MHLPPTHDRTACGRGRRQYSSHGSGGSGGESSSGSGGNRSGTREARLPEFVRRSSGVPRSKIDPTPAGSAPITTFDARPGMQQFHRSLAAEVNKPTPPVRQLIPELKPQKPKDDDEASILPIEVLQLSYSDSLLYREKDWPRFTKAEVLAKISELPGPTILVNTLTCLCFFSLAFGGGMT